MPSLKSRNEMLKQIYNLILDSDISDGERKLFIEAKEQLENNRDFLQVVSELKNNLSLIALQFRLSKNSLNFYSELQKQFPLKDKLWRPGGTLF